MAIECMVPPKKRARFANCQVGISSTREEIKAAELANVHLTTRLAEVEHALRRANASKDCLLKFDSDASNELYNAKQRVDVLTKRLQHKTIDLRQRTFELNRLSHRKMVTPEPISDALTTLLSDNRFRRQLCSAVHPDRLPEAMHAHANTVRFALSL